MVDGEVYKRIRILAIERNMEVSAIIEEAMREKLEREFPQYQPLSSPSQQPQPTQPQQLKRSVISLTLNLPGIEFPANRTKIVKHAEEANTQHMIDFLKWIPEKTYKNRLDLQNELSNEVKNSKAPLAVKLRENKKDIVFPIDVRKPAREQREQILSEQILEQKKELEQVMYN